ncbi:MAG: hypothetical protein KF892_03775 [Rhizobacter sp.]|nr:hypothetical protein [Rhizobacter sp.]
MNSSFPFLEEQFAGSAGVYSTDLALIRLGRDESYWVEENPATLDRLAVFVHEYAHYLHNFSTLAGIYGFVTSLRRLRLFSNTVDESGRSLGSGVLDPTALREYEGTMKFRVHLAGTLGLPNLFHAASLASFEIVGWDFGSQQVNLASQVMMLNSVRVRVRAGSPGAYCEESFDLGSHVLSESVAWELERILFETQKADLSVLDEVKIWPYKFARRFLEHSIGGAVDSRIVAKVVLLALQSTDPGVAFVALAGALKDRGAQSLEEVVERCRGEFAAEFASMRGAIVSDLRTEVVAFGSRKPLHRAFSDLIDTAEALLQIRSQSEFFEIDLVESPDGAALVNMIKSFPPCPIIQPGEDRDEIFYILDREPDKVAAVSLGVAQSALQFAAVHYQLHAIAPTNQVRKLSCRFYGSCGAPQTIAAPERCKEKPWESFDPTLAEQCWYGQGVAQLRSRPSSVSQPPEL